MGNRKQPFGYRMERGEVVRHPQEAPVVEYIFQQYSEGDSFGTLLSALRERSVPYEADKLWNKNMVARILGDHRYTGETGLPAIITEEMWETAQIKRQARQTPCKQTELQKELRRRCGGRVTARNEQNICGLLSTLIADPKGVVAPSAPMPPKEELPQQKELQRILNIIPIDEPAAKECIAAIAAARYNAIGSGEYETVRLRKLFTEAAKVDALLVRSTVSSITVQSNGSVRIYLKNGQILT